jgi:hypothetical protein
MILLLSLIGWLLCGLLSYGWRMAWIDYPFHLVWKHMRKWWIGVILGTFAAGPYAVIRDLRFKRHGWRLY